MLDTTTKTSKTLFHKTVDLRLKVLVLFGTRPESIKLAPVVHELRKKFFQTIVVSISQHKELLKPFLKMLDIKVDFDLRVRIFSIDVFENELDGLVLCETESDGLKDLMSIEPPAYVKCEVTEDVFFQGGNLSKTTNADLLDKLSTFG